MRARGTDSAAAWAEAVLAAELFALAPHALGGLSLRGWPGPARDRLCGWLRDLMPAHAPLLRLPLNITDDRLLGGLALAATLRQGRVIEEPGLLKQAHGGALLAAMAERLEPRVTSQLCSALDRGELSLERDGLTGTFACRLGVVAFDEGIDGERVPTALRDRLALEIDLSALDPVPAGLEAPDISRVQRARGRFALVEVDDEVVDAMCRAAVVLGIDSLRAPLLAVATARAHAALEGRLRVGEDDAAMAGRLVLGPRATQLPPGLPQDREAHEEEANQEENAGEEQGQQDPSGNEPTLRSDALNQQPLQELVLDAAKSAIPAGLLDGLFLGRVARSTPRSFGHAGALQTSNLGGRPAGVLPKQPRNGERLNVVETLRAAAPWQPLRKRERPTRSTHSRRIEVREEDFRVTCFQQRSETNVIFAVDASGSAALERLAEAKGAVEQVLADCYVRRDHVALIAFRGTKAALLLSPTRSLVSVRRSLSRLAGGGTTPLAAGIDAALKLALDARKRGQTPVLVLMTDGRANIARNGSGNRRAAEDDALSGARMVRAASVRSLFLDTSSYPRPSARLLANEMGARYLPLPYLDAAGISRQVQALAKGAP
jgi:magnesium chelatase subunit D